MSMEWYQRLGITSAVAFGCAGVALALYKHRSRPRAAAEALNYLSIVTVSTEEKCDEVVREIRSKCNKHRAVGFDCEWVTEHGKRLPVGLIQVSTFNGLCALFKLKQLKEFPLSLKELLEDDTIYKVGVAPIDDAKHLQQDYSINIRSTLDIRYLAQICGYHPGGLASLSKDLLGVILDKNWRLRCSNWDAEELSQKQVTYAAADAHVAVRIFVKLVNEFGSGGFTSWFSRNTELKIWENLDALCKKYRDIGFSNKSVAMKNEFSKKRQSKEAKSEKNYKHSLRKSPLYHNCILEAPDGEMLCTCDTRKAQWYIDKELADKVRDDPLTVRLRFEPAGRSVGDVGRYYKLCKENKCVVCGNGESYIRKNVVPREYRKYFPDIMKEHSSHDVLLLCSFCHKHSNIHDQAVRARLSVLCDAPLSNKGENCKYMDDFDCHKIRSAARTLLYHNQKHVIPEPRRLELERTLKELYPECREITREFLLEAAEVKPFYENPDYESHGEKVVDYYIQNGGLLKLEQIWRQHFLETMRPKYLPPLWSVKHNEERLQLKLDEGRLNEEDIKLIGHSPWLKINVNCLPTLLCK